MKFGQLSQYGQTINRCGQYHTILTTPYPRETGPGISQFIHTCSQAINSTHQPHPPSIQGAELGGPLVEIYTLVFLSPHQQSGIHHQTICVTRTFSVELEKTSIQWIL